MQNQPGYVTDIAKLFPRQGEWTETDYFGLPESKRFVELWDGVLSIEPMPGTLHQRIVTRLAGLLFAYVNPIKSGEAFGPLTAVKLGEGRIREPDVMFIKQENRARIARRYIDGPPDWVAEVNSSGSRATDTKDKLQQYAEVGIPEYWLIDPGAG
ncbi:MAG: Uma2 family endonuclease, partial [Chloroflexota bacterium]